MLFNGFVDFILFLKPLVYSEPMTKNDKNKKRIFLEWNNCLEHWINYEYMLNLTCLDLQTLNSF